jgi:hypothetical protein
MDEVRPYTRRRVRPSLPVDCSGREPAPGPARPTLDSLAWRYRHELAPFSATLVLATVAGIGHDYAPGWWPVAIPLGAAATAAARRWMADREPEAVYVLAVGAAGTAWTTVAWWAAPWHDWLFWAAVLGAMAAGIPRWWHYRRRGKVTVQRNAPRGARRDLRRIMRNWPETLRVHGARRLSRPAG